MSRAPRLVIPGVPLHITQRGVDRIRTFAEDMDFAFYRWSLRIAAEDAGCAVHAYVLMSNHIHLLVTPADPKGPSQMMMALGRRYVRYFNDRHRRTGTLWEGRYRSTVVNSAGYLFACSRYIELNPVRAGVVTDPAEYEWSSYRHNGLGVDDPIVSLHPAYMTLGSGRDAQGAAYRRLFDTALASGTLATLRATPRARRTLNDSPYRKLLHGMDWGEGPDARPWSDPGPTLTPSP